MEGGQAGVLRIATLRNVIPDKPGGAGGIKARYDFALCMAEDIMRLEKECGGTLVSAKRLPMKFRELAGCFRAELRVVGYARFGHIEMEAWNGGSMTANAYFPKERLKKGQVAGLGYYLDSISTKNAMGEFCVQTVRISGAILSGRDTQLRRVFGEIEMENASFPAREYLAGMGRGIALKPKNSRTMPGPSSEPLMQG